MKSRILILFIICFSFTANAAIKIKNDNAKKYAQQVAGEADISADEAAIIKTLENDIRILDEEITKCEKQKKGWIAATIIGSVGVVSTGIAAGVQGAKLSEKKEDLSAKQSELKELKRTSNELDK